MNAPMAPDDSPTAYTHFATFTLKPVYYSKTVRQQLRLSWNDVNNKLKAVSKQYYLVAELTKKANIHFHAVIQFDESVDYSLDDLCLILIDSCKSSKVLGLMEIERIRDKTTQGTDYLNKDLERTQKILNPRGKSNLDYFVTFTKKPNQRIIETKKIITVKTLTNTTKGHNYLDEFEDII